MDGQIWDAVLQPAPEQGPEANPVVVLSNDEVLLPADAEWGEFTIVEATDEERAALKGLGYSMADWNPLQGLGCSGCHVDGPGNEPLSDDTRLPGA
jgi:hypothetical protein